MAKGEKSSKSTLSFHDILENRMPLHERIRTRLTQYPYLMTVFCFLVVMAVAFWYRLRAFAILYKTVPDPDIDCYVGIAKVSGFYDTQSREPLYIWMTKFVGVFCTDVPFGLRVLSLVGGFLAVALVFYVAKRWFGLLAATVAGLSYAASPAMVFTATRGLREDWVILFLLWFALEYIATWGRPLTWRNGLRIGIPIGLSFLLRMSTFGVILPLFLPYILWSIWKNRTESSWKQWVPGIVVAFSVSIVPTLPYLYYCQKQYNDPFYINNFLGARFYANIEFAGILPGFPTREEIAKDAYAGSKITFREYLFKYHTIPQIFDATKDGITRLCVGDMPVFHYPLWKYTPLDARIRIPNTIHAMKVKMGSPYLEVPDLRMLTLFTLAGYLALLFSLQGRLFTWVILVFHLQVLFLISLNEFDWRLITPFYTYMSIGWGAACKAGVMLCNRGFKLLSQD